jgi:hypothetical protein
MPATYGLTIDLTYSANNVANTAVSNINGVLANYPSITERASRTNTVVTLNIEGLDEATAVQLNTDIIAAWSGGARNGGKVAIARRQETL